MNCKKLLLFIIVALSGINTLRAQQRPYFAQYFINPFMANPALAGVENYWDVKLSYRSQWTGIEGAPKTFYSTANGPFKISSQDAETINLSNARRGLNTPSVRHMENYRSVHSHAGLGFQLLSDQSGPISSYFFNASYAYHVSLSSKASISAGLAAGIQGMNLNTDALNFGSTNPYDPAVSANGSINKLKPDMSLGLWLYSALYFVGVSGQSILPNKITYSQNASETVGLLVPHSSIMAGYKFFLSEEVTLLPSTMIRIVRHTPINFDINTKLQYKELLWIGASYHHSERLSLMAGAVINQHLSLSYSYDVSTPGTNALTFASHEVVIGIRFSRKNRIILSPRNFW